MAECIDQEARDRIAKLWTAHEQHATDYWGPDKANGKRSEVIELVQRMDEMEKTVTTHIDMRKSTCHGIAALNDYLKSIGRSKEELEVEKERAKSLMRIQWLQFAGLVVVALIGLLK
jgi:hypothetical protein